MYNNGVIYYTQFPQLVCIPIFIDFAEVGRHATYNTMYEGKKWCAEVQGYVPDPDYLVVPDFWRAGITLCPDTEGPVRINNISFPQKIFAQCTKRELLKDGLADLKTGHAYVWGRTYDRTYHQKNMYKSFEQFDFEVTVDFLLPNPDKSFASPIRAIYQGSMW